MTTLDDAQKARVHWLLGFLKGAMIGVCAMCSEQAKEVVDFGSVDEIEQAVDELAELVEGMMQG